MEYKPKILNHYAVYLKHNIVNQVYFSQKRKKKKKQKRDTTTYSLQELKFKRLTIPNIGKDISGPKLSNITG